MELKIKTIHGEDHAVKTDNDATLGNLRDLVRQATGVPIDRQRLIYRGRVLAGDEKKLKELHLADGNVLHMVERSDVVPNQRDRPLEPHPDHTRRSRQGAAGRPRNVIIGNVPIQIQSSANPQHIQELVQTTLNRLGEIGRSATVRVEAADDSVQQVTVHMRSPVQLSYTSPAHDRLVNVQRLLRKTNHLLFHVERDIIPELERHETEQKSRGGTNDQSMETGDRDERSFCCAAREVPSAEEQQSAARGQDGSNEESGGSAVCAAHEHAGHIADSLLGNCAEHTAHERAPSAQQHTSTASDTTTTTTGSVHQQTDANGRQITMRHATVADMHRLMASIFEVQERIAPLMRRYHQMLAVDVSYSHSCEGQHVANFFNSMQAVLHFMGHILHTFSDFNIHLCESPPRLLYPRFTEINAAEPTEANIVLIFANEGTADQATNGGAAPARSTPTSRSSSPPLLSPIQFRPQNASFPYLQPGGFNLPFPPMNPPGPVSSRNMRRTTSGNPLRLPINVRPNGSYQIGEQPFPTRIASNQMMPRQFGPFPPRPPFRPRPQFTIQEIRSGQFPPVGTNQPYPRAQHNQLIQQQQQQFGGRPAMVIIPGAAQQQQQGSQSQPGPAGLHNFLGGMLQNALGGVFRNGPVGAGGQQQSGQQQQPSMNASITSQGGPGANIRHQSTGYQQQSENPQQQQPFQMPVGSDRFVQTQNAVPLRQTTGRQATLFLGPRPPADLPLFTLDPFMPCSSHHYDPRSRTAQRPLHHRTGSGTGRQSSSTASSNQPAAPTFRSNVRGQAVFDSDDQFSSFLEHIFRSVISNMDNDDVNAEPATTEPSQLYAYEPVNFQPSAQFPVISGTISVETVGDGGQQGDENDENMESDEVTIEAENVAAAADLQRDSQLPTVFSQITQHLASGSNTPIGPLFRSLGENINDNDKGFISLVSSTVGETLGLIDLLAIFNGDRSSIDRNRNQIRNYLVVNILNGNDRPSEEDLLSAASRTGAERAEWGRVLQDGDQLPTVADQQGRQVDVVQTAVRIDTEAIILSLRTIFGFDPSPNSLNADLSFGDLLISILKGYCREMIYLLNAVYGQPLGYETVIRRYISEEGAPQHETIRSWMNGVGMEQVRSIVESMEPMTEDDVRQRFVYCQQEQEMTSDQPLLKTAQNEEGSVKETSDTESTTSNDPLTIPSSTSSQIATTEQSLSSTTTTAEQQSWRGALPKDWLNVIDKDREKQKLNDTQAPFSDGYIVGMPAKRRKKLASKGLVSSNTDETVLRDQLKQAIEEADVVQSPLAIQQPINDTLLTAFRNQIDEDIGNRLCSDADFDPKKFEAANEYFKKS